MDFTKPLPWAAGAVAFILLATANSAGYRYGVSDQAYYIPAIFRAIDPAVFPRDGTLLDAEAHLMTVDQLFAFAADATGLSLPTLFVVAYLVALTLLWIAALLIGRSVYTSGWAVAALAAALTLRHRITRTGVNTLEGYFHPRGLAFALGALAVVAFLRCRPYTAVALVAGAALIHTTTAVWFAGLVGVALVVANPRARPAALGAAAVAGLFALWAIALGPLQGSLMRMDADWRQAIASKDFLFADQWPAAAWLANLGAAGAWAWAYADRRRRGMATIEDTGLAAGGAAVLALFLVTLPLVASGVALFVQLQISRVFWVIDVFATIYLVAALDIRQAGRRALPWITAVLVAASAVRGTYILQVERAERTLFEIDLTPSPWNEAMQWLSTAPIDAHVLADPAHAWKHGASVRVAARRDVFHEEVKDAALAIYSRDVAMRVLNRSRALGDFNQLTSERARALAREFELDYLVTARPLDLAVVYRNGEFTIHSLR